VTGWFTDMQELMRWAACGAVVVFAHASAAALVAGWSDPAAPGEPAGAIMVDLAPLVTSTSEAHDDVAPGPQMKEAPPQPRRDAKIDETPPEPQVPEQRVVAEEKIEQTPTDAPQVEPTRPAPAPEVAAAAPPPKPAPPRAKPKPSRLPAPATTAPPRAPHLAALTAAPSQGQASSAANAMPSWKGQIVAAIERNKRYPAEAEARREQGMPAVSFSIDRQGRLLSSRVVRASGVAALDQEALAILRRAQPFPPPPAEIVGARFDFTVPIRFSVR
jgi:protein TonB